MGKIPMILSEGSLMTLWDHATAAEACLTTEMIHRMHSQFIYS